MLTPPAKKNSVSQWESGKNKPNKRRLKEIAELGNITVHDLVEPSLNDKQKNCKYCHEADSFINTSKAWEIMSGFMYGMWEQAFDAFSHDLSDNPSELCHGLPDGNSMMTWRRGHQSETVMLTHMWPDNDSGKMAGDLLGPSNCPVCGRPLAGDTVYQEETKNNAY